MKIFVAGGIVEYWSKHRNKFDGFITIASVIVEIIVLAPNDFNRRDITRVLLMFRVLRLLRFLLSFKSYRVLASTYFKLFPVFVRLAAVLFIIYYVFCQIGIFIFGGKIYIGAPALNGTAYEMANYNVLNFNDFGSGMVTLFALMVVNNWFVVMSGFVGVTANGAQVFFIVFWLVAVVTVLSVVVASVLERFMGALDERNKSGKNSLDMVRGSLEESEKVEDKQTIIVRKRMPISKI